MHKQLIYILLMLLWLTPVDTEGQSSFRVLFWNVENLFDTTHDEGKEDYDFLPQGDKRWNKYRYNNKVKKLTEGICRAGKTDWPVMIGLAEVENETAIKGLVHHPNLHRQQYNYLITNSPDRRGINVALLYQSDFFKLVKQNELVVSSSTDSTFKTRNILYAKGVLPTNEYLHCFVCHFPSKRGGAKASEKRRVAASKRLRLSIDSIFKIEQDPQILIMGDFNCEPKELAKEEMLNTASPKEIHKEGGKKLFNLFHEHRKKDIPGSHVYKRIWNQLDQIIVTRRLLTNKKMRILKESAENVVIPGAVEKSSFMKGGIKPKATYQGPYYKGGTSDHLPIKADFVLTSKKDIKKAVPQ